MPWVATNLVERCRDSWGALKQIGSFWVDGRYFLPSFAQEGEDLILRRLFERKWCGFYVDVGALHPKRFSNTYLFYRQGWRGINIDATPGAMRLFQQQRPRDLNLELAVGGHSSLQTLYCFDEPALNTFDPHLAQTYVAQGYRIVATHQVPIRPLAEVLAEVLPHGTQIDFMSIDVEGYDLEVLKSNDWQRFRADIVLVESLGSTIESIRQSELYTYMLAERYELCAKTANTLFFRSSAVVVDA